MADVISIEGFSIWRVSSLIKVAWHSYIFLCWGKLQDTQESLLIGTRSAVNQVMQGESSSPSQQFGQGAWHFLPQTDQSMSLFLASSLIFEAKWREWNKGRLPIWRKIMFQKQSLKFITKTHLQCQSNTNPDWLQWKYIGAKQRAA